MEINTSFLSEINIKTKIDFLQNYLDVGPYSGIVLKQAPQSYGIETFFTTIDNFKYEDILGEYFNGNIEIDDIPGEVFKPKEIYYNRDFLLSVDQTTLTGLIDHELAHVDYTDFKDIIYCYKWAFNNNIDPGVLLDFLNGANEDLYVGNKLIDKGSNKKHLVEYSYLKQGFTNRQNQNLTGKNKINQLSKKLRLEWLLTRFGFTYYDIELKIDNDVEEIFNNEIFNYFNDIISIDKSNYLRCLQKNNILLPIFKKLYFKDLEMKNNKENILNNVDKILDK